MGNNSTRHVSNIRSKAKIVKTMFIYSKECTLSMEIKSRIISKEVIMVSADNKDTRIFLSSLRLGKDFRIIQVPSIIICYADNSYKVVTDKQLLKMCE